MPDEPAPPKDGDTDEKADDLGTYTPRTTRHESVELEAPHGEPRTITFKLIAGTEYEILPDEKADDVIGHGAVSQHAPAIRQSAVPQ